MTITVKGKRTARARRVAINQEFRPVEKHLAACVNILSPCRSVYRWQGKTEDAEEFPMLIKTTRARYPALEAAIRAGHPYELPEIIAVSLTGGLPAYLGWVDSETRPV